MIIWALVGLIGMLSGLLMVGAARHRNQPAETSSNKAAVAAVPAVQDTLSQAA